MSTSLVTITDDLGGFNKTSWIVTAYLTTYTGAYWSQCFQVFHYLHDAGLIPLWTRISDLVGRKRTLNAAIFMFLIFSLACALAETIDQL